MADRDRARNILTRLRDLGVQISVDDFGTGYSSLSYLRDLPPIDELKLDRSFVFPMADDARAAALVISTIGLTHSLGLRMVAEGVENHVVLTELTRHGCDQAQGYYLSRPVPAAELDHWLDQGAHLAPRPVTRQGRRMTQGRPGLTPPTSTSSYRSGGTGPRRRHASSPTGMRSRHRPSASAPAVQCGERSMNADHELRGEARWGDLDRLRSTSWMYDAVIEEVAGRRIRIGRQWFADFASCNYLGFDLDPEIMASITDQVRRWGTHPSSPMPPPCPRWLGSCSTAASTSPLPRIPWYRGPTSASAFR
jgi:hypothetical protein